MSSRSLFSSDLDGGEPVFAGDGTASLLLPLLPFLGEFLLVLFLLLHRLAGEFGFTIVNLFSCKNPRILVLNLSYWVCIRSSKMPRAGGVLC